MNLAPAATQPLVLRPHPFSQNAGIVMVRPGQSLRAMLEEACGGADLSDALEVRIGGYEVPVAIWDRVKPKPGAVIQVTRNSLAGNGDTWRQVAMIAVMVVAMYAGAGGFGTAGGWFAAGSMSANILAAGVYMLGALAVNALIPPPQPSGQDAAGQLHMLTGSQNGINPYGVIPIVLGEHRFFPPHAVMPYTQSRGNTQYQVVMLDLGYGDLEVPGEEIRIGDTPLSQFKDVQWEVTKTPTLYRDDVNEEAVSVTMRDGDAATRTTAAGVDRIGLDIVFPAGLFAVSDEGDFWACNVFFDVEYRAVGETAWTRVPKTAQRWALGYISNPAYVASTTYQTNPFFCRRDDRDPFAASIEWDVPKGQYEVRITRALSEFGDSSEGSRAGLECQWTVLRSITESQPSRTGTTKLCMRIRSSKQLSGTLQTVSCVVRQKIRVYDRATGTWSAPQVNLNPAWVYYWLLTECPAFGKHVSPANVDLEAIADYAEFCEQHGFETRAVVDAAMLARDLIDEHLACALGVRSHPNGKYSVVFDSGEMLPSMSFTPMEIRDFKGARVFTRLPHALKVRFRNPAANWEPDEVIVLDDGYSYRGVDARGNPSSAPEATVFETLDLRFSGAAFQAWQVGRQHFAQAKFRSSTYTFNSDIAGLGVMRGDVVDVTHDVPQWGAGSGRVVSLVAGGEGGAAATLTLDRVVETESGKSYAAQLRVVNPISGAVEAIVVGATPHSVETDTFYLDELPEGAAPGDGVLVGEAGLVTQKLLITGVAYPGDLNTSFSAVAYDDRVAPYWADPPASLISEVTGSRYTEAPDPPTGTVIISDPRNGTPDDSGVVAPEVVIGFTGGGTGGHLDLSHYTLRAL
jgi:hypothetical protein